MSQFLHTTLPNGLRIAAEVYPQAYTAAYGYFVRAGARDETDPQSGLSHFLEHMAFKGTSSRSAADLNRQLDELGGQSNAYTSEEQTVYHATVLPKYQYRIVDLLTDMMRPSLRSDDFETERLVILEEIAKYEDQPPFGAFERVMERRFGTAGLGRRILGTVESIEAMQPEAMRDYFQRRYRPSNMVLAAAGNIDFDALVSQAEASTADWPAERTDGPLLFPACSAPAETAPFGDAPSIATPQASQAYAVRLANAPAANDPRRYAMRLLTTVLGDESGSRLFWELIDTGLAEVAVTWTQEFIDTGLVFTYLGCQPEDVDSNLRLIDEAIVRLVEGGVDPQELQQAINKTAAGIVMQTDRPSNRLFSVGSGWLMRGEHVSVDQQLQRYRSVTVEAIAQLLDQFDLATTAEVHTVG